MKKTVKKIMPVLLAGIMAISLAACGNDQKPPVVSSEVQTGTQETTSQVSSETTLTDPTEITYPLDTDVKLTFYSVNHLYVQDEYASYKESPFHSGLEERTGMEIEWQFPVKGGDQDQAYNLIWVDEELPHIVAYKDMLPAVTKQLYDDGLIWDLTDYLPIYAPDFWAILNSPEYEMVKKTHTAEDGRIYSVLQLSDIPYGNPYQGPMIRKDWLDEQGLEIPITLEDWENVLTVFKEKYNATLSSTESQLRKIALSTGTGCYGSMDANFYHIGNEVRFAQTDEQYKELLTVLNRWYEKGLIDADIFANDNNTLRSKALNNEIGIVLNAQSQLINYRADAAAQGVESNWIGLEYPRIADGEPTTYIPAAPVSYNTQYAAVITTACSEEEMIEALKWMNYGYTEEGSYYWGFGVEGETYTLDENGMVQWTELITENPLGASEAKKRYTGLWGAGLAIAYQGITEAALDPAQIDARIKWRDNTVNTDHAMPTLAYTVEEQQEYNDLFTAITTYVAEMSFKFITGEEKLDNFDKYVETLRGMGLERCREITQAAFDRFNAK